MSKELVISATPHETRVAIMEDGQLCEIYIEREKEFALVGSLYKGRVTRVLPGMQSAFVDIGLDSDAFLYVSDFLEHLEEYDHVAAPVEAKLHKMEQQGGEVFPPSTINGGVVAAPPPEPAAPLDPPPAITPLEGETLHPAAAGQSSASQTSDQPIAPMQHSQRPFEPRRDRGRGGFGDRGGRNRRWGRQGRGGRDRRQGRDLPPSKYASSSHSSHSAPHDSGSYESRGTAFDPVILPGESLAMYKDRAPASAGAPPADTLASDAGAAATQEAPPNFANETAQEQIAAHLPESLYAAPPRQVREDEESTEATASKVGYTSAAENAARLAQAEPEIVHEGEDLDAETDHAEETEVHAHNGTALSEEDVAALAEQLAEAKHEEAQAEAEAQAEEIEKGAEPFVEAAELDELQEALDSDHEGDSQEEDEGEATKSEAAEEEAAEDAAAEADAIADEMHDEAMAAEASGEHAEEHAEHAELHEESHEAADTSNVAGEQPPPSSVRISEQPRARFQRPMRRGGRPQRGRRGGRPYQQHAQHGQRREQHRRPQLISEMLKAGEEIIVQIAKEPLGKKGARITSHVALPGRFLVYMPTVDHIGVSRRIGSSEDRSRLRRLVTEAKGTFPGGFIVRTAAAGASDEEIRTDVEFLGRTWDTIRATSEQRHAPALLHRDLNLVERILRDYLSDDYVAIWLDNEEEFTKVVEFVGRFQPKMVPRVKLYTKEAPIFEEFGIQQELDKALRPKVWLKSGGYIVINHTEALVAIDVNTGKYVGRGSTRLEDTIVKTNLEAVKEIVRQIRLRDLGGIIVVDFIDMEERRNREKVMSALDQALNQDRAPSKALSFNEFGLVCITRKRTKQALERVLCQPCPYCTGSGMVKSIPTICYEIQAEARKMAADLDSRSITLRVNPEIAKAFKTRESSLIEELEQVTHKSTIIQSDPTLHWEQYDIY